MAEKINISTESEDDTEIDKQVKSYAKHLSSLTAKDLALELSERSMVVIKDLLIQNVKIRLNDPDTEFDQFEDLKKSSEILQLAATLYQESQKCLKLTKE